MIITTVVLLYGLLKTVSWCILLWVITLTIYWVINLGASVISVMNYIIEGLEEELEQTSNRTSLILVVQATWLFAVTFIWYYWKTIHECNNVANLVQYVAENYHWYRDRQSSNDNNREN
ncbi:uncharacterized protein LOC135134680 [Zophobas morio]|uniref:uncharacterized protein LOC135134680 n=1 Tax=Zophobas morio TaxID=2755281 RepID=UPI0030828A36